MSCVLKLDSHEACHVNINNLQAGAVYEASYHQPSKVKEYAPAAVTMLFLFNLGYV